MSQPSARVRPLRCPRATLLSRRTTLRQSWWRHRSRLPRPSLPTHPMPDRFGLRCPSPHSPGPAENRSRASAENVWPRCRERIASRWRNGAGNMRLVRTIGIIWCNSNIITSACQAPAPLIGPSEGSRSALVSAPVATWLSAPTGSPKRFKSEPGSPGTRFKFERLAAPHRG